MKLSILLAAALFGLVFAGPVRKSARNGYSGNQVQASSAAEPQRNPEVSIYDYLGVRSMLPLYKAMFNELALWMNGIPAVGPPAAAGNDGEAPGTYNNGYNNGWNGFGGGGTSGIGRGVPGFGGGGRSGFFGG